MERARSVIIILCFIIYFNAGANYKTEIYKAYISGDMKRWCNILELMLEVDDESSEFQLELINYLYGYIAWCLGVKKTEEAEKYLLYLEEKLKKLEKREVQRSQLYSYWSAYYGFKVGLNKFRAPFLGPKSVKYAEMAIQLNYSNPFGYIQMGNSEFYRPAIFGGSKKKAIRYYLEAERLMESNYGQVKNDWNYLNLLVAIAQVYVEVKDYASAKRYFDKILKFEPEFQWVKNVLYPEFLKMNKMFNY